MRAGRACPDGVDLDVGRVVDEVEESAVLRSDDESRCPHAAGSPSVAGLMSAHLVAVCFDARDPEGLADFWGDLLGWDPSRRRRRAGPERRHRVPDPVPPDGGPQDRARTRCTSTSRAPRLEAQQRTVARVLAMGGRHVDVGQRPEEEHVVLGGPRGQRALRHRARQPLPGRLRLPRAVVCDGSQAVGLLLEPGAGLALVWDQDEETAIRSPHGGPIIRWGGPPSWPRPARPGCTSTGSARRRRPARGGRTPALPRCHRVDIGQGEVSWVFMADPGGHEFCVPPPAPLQSGQQVEGRAHRAEVVADHRRPTGSGRRRAVR